MVMDPKFLYYNYIPTLADHVIDSPKEAYTRWGITPKHNYPPFDANNVKDNDIIFVKANLLPQFFHHLYGRIQKRFILLTGVSDVDIPPHAAKLLEEGKIIRWIGCNLCFQHPKVVKIPIAFEETERCRGGPSTGEGGDQQLLSELRDGRRAVGEKTCKLLVTHMGNTHASRGQMKDIFAGKEFAHFMGKMDFESYMKTIDEYRFVLCPRGCGTDTHRFWEVLLMGSIPVVEKDGLWDLYDNFPCVIVDKFANVSRELLESYILNEEKQKNVDKYLVIDNFKSFVDGVVASAGGSLCSIPISIGELWDKYTILLIKKERIDDAEKVKRVENEIEHLEPHVRKFALSAEVQDEMKSCNEKLWDIEDAIRDKELKKEFDEGFVELARSVYRTNDERSRIKDRICGLFNSEIREVKSYKDYA
jgi:hypothetical protein